MTGIHLWVLKELGDVTLLSIMYENAWGLRKVPNN